MNNFLNYSMQVFYRRKFYEYLTQRFNDENIDIKLKFWDLKLKLMKNFYEV